MQKVKTSLLRLKNIVVGFRIPWWLPRLYTKLLLLGLILVGLNYSYIPNLTYCSNLFDGNFCSPIGLYIIAFASVPGYLIINATLPSVAAGNDSLYSLIVFVTSLLIYSIVGYLFSKKKSFSFSSTGAVYLVFLSLLFALLFLVSLMRG